MVDRDSALPDVDAIPHVELPPLPDKQHREEQLRLIFKSLDTDGNGVLDPSEFQVAVEAVGLPSSNAYMKELMQQYDRNADGEITFEEFKKYVDQKERKIWEAFSRVDADNNGFLDAAELAEAFRGMGIAASEADAERLIHLLDLDNDQKIDYMEFKRFIIMLPSSQLRGSSILAAWLDSADWSEAMQYRMNTIPRSQPWERFIAGGVAGAVSRTVVAPLERLRTIMMADKTASALLPTMRRMWADGGLPGLFRGNGATVMKVFPASAIQFAVYDGLKDIMLAAQTGPASSRHLTTVQQLSAGMAAGAAATLATYPLEVLRTQISVNKAAADGAQGYSAIIRSLIRQRGFTALYSGFGPGVVNNSVTQALGFCSYEGLCKGYRRFVSDDSPSTAARGMLGGMSAFLVMTATMPLENVMRRMQIQGSPGYPVQYKNGFDCALLMAKEEGPRAFWRGSLSSYMKVVPSIAAVRFLYEGLVAFYGIGGVRRYRRAEEG